jgi:hypothetical protein
MGFKEVASLDAEKTIALGGVDKKTGRKNPTSVEGYYLGSRTVESKKGESKIHFFQTEKGNLGVWGKTDSNRKLGAVTPGTMTRISFDKMQETPNGEMYKYKVEIDSDNVIDVGGIGSNYSVSSGSDSDSESVSDFNSSDEDTSDDVKEEFSTKRKSSLSDVQALFSKSKKG